MRILSLFAGIALGVLLAQALGWATRHDPLTVPAFAHESVEDDDEVARLREENRRLMGELRARQDVLRREAEERATSAAEQGSDSPSAPISAGTSSIREELRLLLDSDVLRRLLENDPSAGLDLLLRAYMEADRAADAFRVLQRIGITESNSGYLEWVFDGLRSAGDRAAAIECGLLALEHGELYPDMALELSKLAPDRALAMLDRLAAESPDAGYDSLRVFQLFALGRGDEAEAVFAQLVERGEATGMHWEEFVSQRPELAVGMLRDALAGGGEEDEAYFLRGQLIAALRDSGQTEAALGELRSLLAGPVHDTELVNQYFELDPEGARAWLEDRLGSSDGQQPELLVLHAEHLMADGRQTEAVGILWRLFDESQDWRATRQLLEHDTALAVPRMTEDARRRRDDELLGDIADRLWAVGSTGRAEQLWREAAALDPGDGEWSEKLADVANGRDPLQ
jgi:tetratricopeptide (TPR) repeat protein